MLVTGTIGDAALGLQLRTRPQCGTALEACQRRQRAHLRARYLVPEPRNALAEAVRKHATGAMDVSDGLAGDLGKLCRASGVGAEIDVARVPLSTAARKASMADRKLIETVLTGGDDYEIVCTVPPDALAAFQAAARAPACR